MTTTGETGEIGMTVRMTLTAGVMIGEATATMETEGIVAIATGAETVPRFVLICHAVLGGKLIYIQAYFFFFPQL